jgi:hypothetical protein
MQGTFENPRLRLGAIASPVVGTNDDAGFLYPSGRREKATRDEGE